MEMLLKCCGNMGLLITNRMIEAVREAGNALLGRMAAILENGKSWENKEMMKNAYT